MTDHGDDAGQWPEADAGAAVRTDEEWARIAGYVRHSANKLGPDLPLCLPGEPNECGRRPQQHVLAWAAELKARAHHLIETSAPDEARGAHAAGPLYRRRVAELRERS
ncbi:hypothetical protein [Streptomyces phytophilus]|uniref:hypothetical protein n=1 Tax=Streptomyces phytophilus TaxID=722715 RepID=UPI0015F05BE7|nr:hypothetical protein [Streptomyces phytophilus]